MSGVFITFEGIEGSGKTTLIARVAEALRRQGRDLLVTREPGGSTIGDEIRNILLNPAHSQMAPLAELLLYGASRAQHMAEVIRPALVAGRVVLCDRYADATAAYQGAARRLPSTVIRQLRKIATDGLEPLLTILLDLPVQVGLARMSNRGPSDRLEKEARVFHERVRRGYLRLAKKEPERIKIVDADRAPEAIFNDVMQCIRGLVN